MAQDAGYRTGYVQLFHRNRLVRSHVSREIKRIDTEKPDLVFVSLFVDRLDNSKQLTKAVRLLRSVMERQLKGGRQLLLFGQDNASTWCNVELAPMLQDELRQYRSGRAWTTPRPLAVSDDEGPPATTDAAASEGLGPTHLRRQAVRHRPYAPNRSGRRHSQQDKSAQEYRNS